MTAKLVLSRQETADHLGISLQTFKRHVQPNLRTLKIGDRVLIPVTALAEWIEDEASYPSWGSELPGGMK